MPGWNCAGTQCSMQVDSWLRLLAVQPRGEGTARRGWWERAAYLVCTRASTPKWLSMFHPSASFTLAPLALSRSACGSLRRPRAIRQCTTSGYSAVAYDMIGLLIE